MGFILIEYLLTPQRTTQGTLLWSIIVNSPVISAGLFSLWDIASCILT